MLLSYGKKFVDQWAAPDTDALIAHWERELGGYTDAEIRRGVKAMDNRDWPPTLPEFKRMCRPPIDPLTAYHEALRGLQQRKGGKLGEWSHPAIYWAAAAMAFDLESATWSSIRPRWEVALNHQLGRGEWPAIPVAVPGLRWDANARTRNGCADLALQALGMGRNGNNGDNHASNEAGNDKPPKANRPAPRDELRWARKILARVAAGGDQFTTKTVVEMAQAALGIRP